MADYPNVYNQLPKIRKQRSREVNEEQGIAYIVKSGAALKEHHQAPISDDKKGLSIIFLDSPLCQWVKKNARVGNILFSDLPLSFAFFTDVIILYKMILPGNY
jgi:hypothetical protein